MKKTIAILLVLVIGMVGVWAATADLLLTTTVFEVNQMSIIAPEGEIPWAEFTNAAAIAEATSSYSTTRQIVDPYIETPQYIADVHTRTNNRQGYTITVQATQLASSETVGSATDIEVIDYTIYNDNGSTSVYTTSASLTTAGIFMSDDASTSGLRIAEKPVYVKLLTTGDSLNAGTYEGAIYFTYTAD